MPKLAAVILCCNEDNVLARCLTSLRDVAELHVSIDESTTDNSEAVARQYTQNIYRHQFGEGGFAGARNCLQEQAELATDAEWFLWIDPDEWLAQGADVLLGLLEKADAKGVQSVMVRMMDVPVEAAATLPSSWMNSKLFKRGLRFQRRRHEHLPSNLERAECPEIVIKHQKGQRHEVQLACNKLKIDLAALIADWQEFGDQRSAFYVGDAYTQAGDFDTAISWFHRGLQQPNNIQGARAQLLQGLCKANRLLGKHDEAHSAAFEMWSEDWRNTTAALFELGCIAANAGWVDAAALWFRLLNQVPENIVSVNNVAAENPRELSLYGYAVVCCCRHQYDQALEYLSKATALAGVDRVQFGEIRQKIVAGLKGTQPCAE